MVTEKNSAKRVMLALFKGVSRTHTITSLAKDLGLSRVGAWKVLKKLEAETCIKIKSVGTGKTSTAVITLDWSNNIVDKRISLYLAEEAVGQRRWQVNFAGLESIADFVILYGSILKSARNADDIDIIIVAGKDRLKQISDKIDDVQQVQSKRVHHISFTAQEFRNELQKPNPAFVDAVENGIILFGHEEFAKFLKRFR
jgi:DNA-binding Lrp family transcriptional regulator